MMHIPKRVISLIVLVLMSVLILLGASSATNEKTTERFDVKITTNDQYAVLVGIEDYLYVNDLDYTVDDAYDVYSVLLNNCSFNSNNIRVLVDANATKENIRNNITWMVSSAKPGDVVFFFFSGHGSKINNNECLVTYETETITSNEISTWLNDINNEAKIVICIDTCYSGGMIDSTMFSSKEKIKGISLNSCFSYTQVLSGRFAKGLARENMIVLTSCDKDQYSYEDDILENGVFTYYIVEGLVSQLADVNSNGWVSIEESFYYAHPKIYDYNTNESNGERQNAQIYDNIEGELDISILGDLIINDTCTYNDKTLLLNRNITIENNGNLILTNTTLTINCTQNGEHYISVQTGGKIYIHNSIITAFDPDYHYNFWVLPDSNFEMINSELYHCGWNKNIDYYGLNIKTSNVIIENSIISKNYVGITLNTATKNTIRNCTIYSNEKAGISILSNSNNNTIINSIIHNNTYGIDISNSYNNKIINCSSYNNEIGARVRTSSSNNTIENCNAYNNKKYGINIQNASYNTIINTKIHNNKWEGTYIGLSTHNTITDSISYDNLYGIMLYQSEYNTIIRSIIYDNEYGIYICWFSNNNLIYHNNFINNTLNAYDDCYNQWNNQNEGNYWSDYTGTDANNDTIGDTVYNISNNNKDNYPLICKFTPYDKDKPTIHLISPPNNSIIKGATTLKFEIEDENLRNVTYYVNDNINPNTFFSPYNIETNEWTDGTYNITIIAQDLGSNINMEVFTFTIDNTKPKILIIAECTLHIIENIINNTYYNTEITLIIEIKDENLDTNKTIITLNNLPFENSTNTLPEGQYTLFVSATDIAGNTLNTTITFTIDKTAPTITITNLTNNSYYNTDINANIHIEDTNLNTSLITLNNNIITSMITITDEGNYILTVQATDKANNIATKTITFTIDKTPPTILMINPPTNIETTKNNITLEGRVFETNITLKINDEIIPIHDKIFTKNITLQEGQNNITITATDQAGNTRTESIIITKTTPKPQTTNKQKPFIPSFEIAILIISILIVTFFRARKLTLFKGKSILKHKV